MRTQDPLWKKIVKGLVTLGGLFGLMSITNLKVSLDLWSLVIISFLLMIIVFHIIGIYEKFADDFEKMKSDIKYIRKQASRNTQ